MPAHAVIIEPEAKTRDSAVELLEKQGFDVTELAEWEPGLDGVISDGTTFLLVQAKTFDEHVGMLEEIRTTDESLPVFVVGSGLSRGTRYAALEAGMVQYLPNYDKAIAAAVHAFRATWKRSLAWRGAAALLHEEMAVARPAGAIGAIKELHDSTNGRIDAARVAGYLGVSLAFMAKALRRNYSTVAKTPAAESLQAVLQDFKRVIEVLQHVLGDSDSVRIWMNTPHPDLDGKTPRDVAEGGNVNAVRRLIDGTLSGNMS